MMIDELLYDQLVGCIGSGSNNFEVAMSMINAISDVDTDAVGSAAGYAPSAFSLIMAAKNRGVDQFPNPLFVVHKIDDGGSPYTAKYLKNRSNKGIAGSLLGMGGKAASSVTQADVVGVAKHANACGSTAGHVMQLRTIAKKHKDSKTICGWLDLVLRMKTVKGVARGTQLAGSAIPVPGLGLATGLAAAAIKLGVKFTHGKLCDTTAAEIHWRAYQEQVIAGAGAFGPAGEIVYELFTRRGITRIFGKYDVGKIICEPNGWMAVSDKIKLI
jgi:hypothetical protein